MNKTKRVILAAMMCVALYAHAETATFTVKSDTLGPCLITIAEPETWNGDVLLYAHGMKLAKEPLSATIDTSETSSTRPLLEEGWLVAASSFRRNGYIIDDAVEDMEQLRRHIVDTYGAPKRIFLRGDSMGGDIVVLLAERFPVNYAGALSGAPALRSRYTHAPKIPILFLSTSDELKDSRQYIAKAQDAPVRPALWFTRQTGHCNYTGEEVLTALRGLVAFTETGKCETEKDVTGSRPPPASTATLSEGEARAAVKTVSSNGNVNTTFTPDDLAKLGIAQGARFSVTVRDKTANVFYGITYGDVPKGEWVGMIRDGFLRVARNTANAKNFLQCEPGDEIVIAPIPEVTEETEE